MLVVGLHGFLGTGADWKPIFECLQKRVGLNVGFQAPDLFAKGSRPINSFRQFASELNQSAARVSGPRILMGYSLGGRLALHAAFDSPTVWDHVVLLSTHPGLTNVDERQSRSQSDLKWAKAFRTENWKTVIQNWNSQEVFRDSVHIEPEENQFDREQLAAALEHWSLSRQELPWGDQAHSRLHWVVGEKDKKFATLAQNMVKNGFAENLTVLAEAGHRLLREAPEEISRLVAGQLDTGILSR